MTKKWSNTYKKNINCKKPKGFSQKQYCKYGRNKTKKKKGIREAYSGKAPLKYRDII